MEDIEVDPQLLFQCIITVEYIEQLFQYELRAGFNIFMWLFWLYERDRHTLHYMEHVWMRSKRHSQRVYVEYKGVHSVPYVNDTVQLSDHII